METCVMAEPSPKSRRKLIAVLWVCAIDIVALLADASTLSDWLSRSGLLS